MRILFALFAFALVVRAAVFGLHPDAAYSDSYYYVDVARALHAGQGFNIDSIYSFLDVGGRLPSDPHLPVPNNGFWMPLASLVQLPTLWLMGPSPLASALPFMLIGALSAPLTLLIAREVGSGPKVAVASALAVALPAATTMYVAQPDNIALYQPIGMAVFWLTARSLKGHRGSFAMAGLLVGLATLSRNDGLLLGAIVALAFFWDRRRSSQSNGARPPQISLRAAVACFGLFVVVVAPWYARQLVTFGSLSPSSGSNLFVRTYQDTNCLSCPVSLGYLLGQGPGPLAMSRLTGLIWAVVIFSLVIVSIAVVPFAVAGARARLRSVDFGPFLVFGAMFFAVESLLFAPYITYGTFLHSAVALAPYTFILAFEGTLIAGRWAARHRATWTEAGASRLFMLTAGTSVALGAFGYAAVSIPQWNAVRDNLVSVGQALDRAGASRGELVLSADPAGIKYFTSHGGVVTPGDSLEIIRRVAGDDRIRWLVLDRSTIVDPMIPVFEGLSRPSWIGAPILTVPYTGPRTGDPVVDAAPALAVYLVCTTSTDTRCGAAP